VTGFTLFEYGISGKWLELLKKPAIGIGQFAAAQTVAPSLVIELSPVDVRDAPAKLALKPAAPIE
jgi:putative tryptophan/tyrosine transport system substrate-binding protein